MHIIDVMKKLQEIAEAGYDNEDIQRGIDAAGKHAVTEAAKPDFLDLDGDGDKIEYKPNVQFDNLNEAPKDFDGMKLDSDKKQESLNFFYKEHAPSLAKAKKIGSFKGYDIVSFTFGIDSLIFLVKDDIPVLYLAVEKYKDGLAVGNVRSNGTVRATDFYFYVLNNLTNNLYSDKHQTQDGRKIWVNLEKYYDVDITDEGDRLHATVSKSVEEGAKLSKKKFKLGVDKLDSRPYTVYNS